MSPRKKGSGKISTPCAALWIYEIIYIKYWGCARSQDKLSEHLVAF